MPICPMVPGNHFLFAILSKIGRKSIAAVLLPTADSAHNNKPPPTTINPPSRAEHAVKAARREMEGNEARLPSRANRGGLLFRVKCGRPGGGVIV